MREWLTVPAGTLETIMEYRAYAQAKAIYDRTTDRKALPKSPMIEMVKTIEFALVQAEISGRE